MNDTVAVVLAAGKGTRMKSRTPKVLHPLLGRPLLHYPLEACRGAGIARIVVVVGHRADEVRDALGAPGVSFALQAEQRGTGHAVQCSQPELGDFRGTALLLCGDVPLVRPETLRRLLDEHRRSGRLVTVLSMEPPDPTGYGRLVRGPDGGLLRIVEEADASEAERAVREVNTGTYAVDVPWLWEALARIGTANRQGEHYLTDIVAAAASEARAGSLRLDDPDEVMGINSRAQLAEACSILRARINRAWMEAGVTLEDPASTWIETDVALEPDVTLGPACRLMGGTRVAEGARIDQGVVASDCEIGPGAHVKPYCVMTQARVGPGAEVGPFAHLRPGAVLEESSKVGNFVEMKKSVLGRGSKASHLTYLGDTTVGEKANIGAGTITCNYDGARKHHTTIGDRAFIGSNTSLVAPVRVGAGAVIGAGSTITRDVPDDALGVARPEQRSVERWRTRKEKGKD